LAELKTLKAKERLPDLRIQNTVFDGLFEIPTLQEIIALVRQKSREIGRIIGIYPETKHPSYFSSIGLSIEENLIDVLNKNDCSKVFIQSFEVANLKKLARMTDFPLIQLINESDRPYDFVLSNDSRTYQDLIAPAGLTEIATYATGIGVHKNLLVPRNSNNYLLSPTTLVEDAHAKNLLVHAWTFRNENIFLSAEFQNNPSGEYRHFYRLGIDGAFSDFPDEAARSATSDQ
jgi:glycerophosphoryl diester phosphodiesterase